MLKIALIGVAIYAVWKTFSRWKGLYDRFVGRPDEPQSRAQAPVTPPQPQAPPQPSKRIVEDAQICGVCGAFFSVGAGKCGQPNCPLP